MGALPSHSSSSSRASSSSFWTGSSVRLSNSAFTMFLSGIRAELSSLLLCDFRCEHENKEEGREFEPLKT